MCSSLSSDTSNHDNLYVVYKLYHTFRSIFFVIHVHVYDYRYLILQLDKLSLKRQILSTFKSFSTD